MRDVLNEAGSTVDQLREQLRASEVRCSELFEYGQFMERQLIEAKAELSRVESEWSSQQLSFQEINAALQDCQSSNNALTFQLDCKRESGSTSSRRDWSYLWDKIQDLIVQDREDSNAQSVLKSLQSATPAPKTKAVPAIDGGNGKTKAPPAAPKTKAAPTKVDPPPPPIAPGAPAPNAAKPKTKAKAKAKAMTDAEKAKTPCIFFQMPSGCIHGDNCKFSAEAES